MLRNKINNLNISKEDINRRIIDAHIHLWVDMVQSTSGVIPNIDNYDFIKNELVRFKSYGGSCVIDCTPYGCGRDGNVLRKLIIETGVNIIAVTGFHKSEYYKTEGRVWNFNNREAEDLFIYEISNCLMECSKHDTNIRADLIKIAFNGELEGKCLNLTNAAINASKKTNTQILVHTDQGLNIEYLADYIETKNIDPRRVILNHIDKRNDINLHVNLARRGFYLEYDTFLRPKYNPDKNLWPLIVAMVDAGFENSIVVGSDIYGSDMWKEISQNGGLANFFNLIIYNLQELKIPKEVIEKIIGGNAVKFLGL